MTRSVLDADRLTADVAALEHIALDLSESDRTPIRIVEGELARVVDQAEDAIRRSGLPIFVRAGALVRPVIDSIPASRGRMTTIAKLEEIGVAGAIDLLSQIATFERFDARKRGWKSVDPPERVAAILLSRHGRCRFERVAGVITTPTLRPDGSVLSTDGYDPTTRLFLARGADFELPLIKEAPSRRDAEAALRLISDLLDEFPFVGAVDRAVALSALLTPVLRGGMATAPMHAIRASTPGTGKSFLIDLASLIATGRPCPVIAAGKSDEETEKRLGALLREGVPIVSLDNVNGELGGDFLCQLTERPIVRVRILGKSETPEFECRATVFANGNNLTLVGDMTRRAILCTLDTNLERPELREFAQNPDGLVLKNRGGYVRAALTIARAYQAAGSPEVCPRLASYDDWSRSVRAPLIWLGEADPVESMEKAREEDPELAAIRELFAIWPKFLAELSPYTAAEIMGAATEQGASSELSEFLLRIAGVGREISSRRLGRWLVSIGGRVVEGRKLTVMRNVHGSRFSLSRQS